MGLRLLLILGYLLNSGLAFGTTYSLAPAQDQASQTQEDPLNQPVTVAITYFEPYGTSRSNTSRTHAYLLREELTSLSENIHVELVELPVVYGVASSSLFEQVSAMDPKPTMVLSLGQTDKVGKTKLMIELAGCNSYNSNIADDWGRTRSGPIEAGGAEKRFTTLPLSEMLCSATQRDRNRVVLSSTSGYVCNDTLFRSLDNLRNFDLRLGFIHVSKKTAKEEHVRPVAASLARMVLGGLVFLEQNPEQTTPLLPLPVWEELPRTRDEARRLFRNLEEQDDRECFEDYLDSIIGVFPKS